MLKMEDSLKVLDLHVFCSVAMRSELHEMTNLESLPKNISNLIFMHISGAKLLI